MDTSFGTSNQCMNEVQSIKLNFVHPGTCNVRSEKGIPRHQLLLESQTCLLWEMVFSADTDAAILHLTDCYAGSVCAIPNR